MRLSTEQVQAIRQAARRVLGDGARVSVFGSKALDDRKGGDIDLLFETDAQLDNRANVICELTGALTLALGDRKIDVLLKPNPVCPTRRLRVGAATESTGRPGGEGGSLCQPLRATARPPWRKAHPPLRCLVGRIAEMHAGCAGPRRKNALDRQRRVVHRV